MQKVVTQESTKKSKACKIEVDGRVIYPGHGLAVVVDLVTQEMGEGEVTFYKLVFPYNKNMEILVPEDRIEACGIRAVGKPEEIEKTLQILKEVPHDLSEYASTAITWKKRQKVYRSMIESGKLADVAAIYRDLTYTSEKKELSFGEKDMLYKAEGLISQEIYAARKLDGGFEEIISSLRMAVKPHAHLEGAKPEALNKTGNDKK